MFRKVSSSKYYDRMLQSVETFNRHFDINHFWYNKVTYSGDYEYFGTNKLWDEYCSRNIDVILDVPFLTDPASATEGIQLLGLSDDKQLQNLRLRAKDKYKINFNLHLLKKSEVGIEGFGFATKNSNSGSYERLLNELPLLTQFIKKFREENAPIFDIVREYSFNLEKVLGIKIKKEAKRSPYNRQELLENLGFHIPALTDREFKMLEYIAHGYPASYIAKECSLSKRTIESHIEKLKNKLTCNSKVELIHKAREIITLMQNFLTQSLEL